MRKLTTNNLSIACLYYSSIENKWRQAMIAHVCDPVLTWYVNQNKTNRSCHGTLEYLQKHVRGGWLCHIRRIMDVMKYHKALQDCGMTMDLTPVFLRKGNHEADCGVCGEQATTFGRLVAALTYARIRFLFNVLWVVNSIMNVLLGSCYGMVSITCTCMCTCMFMYIHVCMHKCIHAHICFYEGIWPTV